MNVCAGNAKIVDALIQGGADVNGTDGNGWTPLHFAARFGIFRISYFNCAQNVMKSILSFRSQSSNGIVGWKRSGY